MSAAQFRLTKFLKSGDEPEPQKISTTNRAAKKRRRAPETPSDLVLSEEMIHWIGASVEQRDEDGYLEENLSSVLAKPLDSMAVFCPTGDLITAKTTAIRPPERLSGGTTGAYSTIGASSTGMSKNRYTMRSQTANSYESSAHDPLNDQSIGTEERDLVEFENRPPEQINAAIDRLNVMWLKRKAALEEAEGEPEQALKTLQEAIDLHIGAKNYMDAQLTDYVMASNPYELMEQIEENYLTYDESAHKIATKLQQWLHRCFMVRYSACLRIQTFFRRFLARHAAWKRNHLRSQLARLIQRRFRKHLKKMHALATRIKAWYRSQRDQRSFRARLRIFRAARKIQCLRRGQMGRRAAAKKHLLRDSVRKVQRCFRGYCVRRNRLLGITAFHKNFYCAARKLQTWFRSFFAIRRAQRRVIAEITREEYRMKEEHEVLQRTIQVEMARIQLYLKTAAGKLHLDGSRAYVTAKDNRFQMTKHKMSREEILEHDALIVFELYDADGSGSIDLEELTFMIRDLCLPLSKVAIAKLASDLDKDGGGDIDFNEFLDWYAGGGGDKAAKEAGMGAGIFTTMLKSRRYALEISGQTLARRCARDVVRQFCSWLSRETRTLFRMAHAPKFQCCQCMQPFVLFMDYFMHFNKRNGHCPVEQKKGMFFPTYWVMSEWRKQRLCEKEVLRTKDEYPYLSHKALVAIYEDLAIQKDPGIFSTMKAQISAAERMYTSILDPKPPKKSETDPGSEAPLEVEEPFEMQPVPETVDLIMDIVDMCKDGFLSPNVAKYVASCIGVMLPEDWLLNDRWPMSQFKSWVKINTENVRSNRAGCCVPCSCLSRNTGNSMSEAKLLGTIFVGCLRLLQVGAETSLVALTSFRARRPRRLNVNDTELHRVGLSSITKEAYKETRAAIIRRLRHLQLAKNKLYLETVQNQKSSCFSCLKRKDYSSIAPEEMDADQMRALQVEEAHIRAHAEYTRKLMTAPGKTQMLRTRNELWAFKRILLDKMLAGKNSMLHDPALVEYTYDLFSGADCCKMHDDEIPCFSSHDIPLLLRHLLCKTNAITIEKALRILDPAKTGYVTFDAFQSFMSSKKFKDLGVFIRPVRWYFRHAYRRVFLTSYKTEAKLSMLVRTRQLCRHKNEINGTLLDAIINWSERKLQDYFEENGVMPGEDSLASRQLALLNDVNARNEYILITRMAEDAAEKMTKSKLWRTSKGRNIVRMESHLLEKSADLCEGLGYCITAGEPIYRAPLTEDQSALLTPVDCVAVGKRAYIKLVLCTYDTDCSSTFDQEEISFLLKCLGRPLDEKNILYQFPEVRYGPVSFKRMMDYTSRHGLLSWRNGRAAMIGGGRVPAKQWPGLLHTASRKGLAKNVVICRVRQRAKERTEDAKVLADTGKLPEKDNTEGVLSGCLLARAQMLAMRQVDMFLITTHGKFQHFISWKHVKEMWHEYMKSSNYSRMGAILYAVDLHAETRNTNRVILDSEVPQIIRYLDKVFKLSLAHTKMENVSKIIGTMLLAYKPKLGGDMIGSKLNWLDMRFLVDTLHESLEQEINLKWAESRKESDFQSDAYWSMQSRARQQACVLAVNEMGVKVVTTNYRCRVLAIEDILRKKPVPDRKASKALFDNVIPKECSLLYLISKGFSFEDMMFDFESEEIVNFSHWDGQLSTDLVDRHMSEMDVKTSYMQRTKSTKIGYWAKTTLVPRVASRRRFLRYLIALIENGDEVEAKASLYNTELLTGVTSI